MEWLVSGAERELGIERRQLALGEGRQLVALVPARWAGSLRQGWPGPCPRPEGLSTAELSALLQRSAYKLPAGWTRVSIQGVRKRRLSRWQPPEAGAGPPDLDSLCGFMSHVAEQNFRNLWREAHCAAAGRCQNKATATATSASQTPSMSHATPTSASQTTSYGTPTYSSQTPPTSQATPACTSQFTTPDLSNAPPKNPNLAPPTSTSHCTSTPSSQATPTATYFPPTAAALPTHTSRAASLDAFKAALSRALGCSLVRVEAHEGGPSPAPAPRPIHPNLLPAHALLETTEALYLVQQLPCYTLRDAVTFSPAKLAGSHAKVLFVLYQALQALRACHREGLAVGGLTLAHLALDEKLFTQVRLNLGDYEGDDDDEEEEEEEQQQPEEEEAGALEPSSEPRDLRELVTSWVQGRVSNFAYLMGVNRLAGRRSGDPNYHPVLPWVVDFSSPHGGFRDLRKSKFRLTKGDKQLDFTYKMAREALWAEAGGPGARVHVPHHIPDVLSDITYYVYTARRAPRALLCRHVRAQWEPHEYPGSVERMAAWTPDECIPEYYSQPALFQSLHPDMADLQLPAWCTQGPAAFVAAHRRLLESREVSQELHHWLDLTFGYRLSGREAVRAKNICLPLVDAHTHLTCYGVVQLFDQPHPQRMMGPAWALAEPPALTGRPQAWRGQGRADGATPEEEEGAQAPVGEEEGAGDLEEGTEALDSLSALDGPSAPSLDVPPAGPPQSKAWGPGEKEEGPVHLPEGFNPLQALEELEKLSNFLTRGLQSSPPDLPAWDGPTIPSLSCLLQRDMQSFGVLVAEIFFAQRLRPLGLEASLPERFQAVCRLAQCRLREVAEPLQQAVLTLLHLQEERPGASTQPPHPALFHFPAVLAGLPPPSPSLLLSPCCPIIPFPAYFPRLHRLACSFSAPGQGIPLGREFVFSLWQQLDRLLEVVEPEGLEILLPFVLELLSAEGTAVYSAWYLFEPMARALGPRGAQRCLLSPLAGVYERPGYLPGRFYLYTDCFVLQLMVRLGLQPFLTSLLPHILQVLTGQEGTAEAQGLGGGPEDEAGLSYGSKEGKEAADSGSYMGCELSEGEEPQGGIFGDEQEAAGQARPSDGSSNGEASGEEQGPDSETKDGMILPSPRGQDMGLAEEEEEEEEAAEEEGAEQAAPLCTTPEGRLCEVLRESAEQEQELEEEELTEGKEQKILLDTACKTVKWLSAKLGPTLCSRHIVRNLLRLLVTCYFGPEKQQFVLNGEEDVPCVGSIYKHRPVLGDLVAQPVLECLVYVAQLYGEPLLTYQCLPYVAYLVAPSNSRRLNSRKEASLLAAMVLMQKIIVYLSDTTLMDILPKVNQDLLLPVLEVLTSPLASFPGGAQARSVLGVKTLSLIALVCLRIGQEMVVQHMSETLRRFFEGFSIMPEQREKAGESDTPWPGTPETDAADWDPAALDELDEVFSLEMAFSAYIPFNCLIGDTTIRRLLRNHELVWGMAARYQEEVSGRGAESPPPPSPDTGDPWPRSGPRAEDGASGTFGSAMVGNRIEIGPGARPAWLPLSGDQEPGSLKQELGRSGRCLDGNWLAHWRYEVGRGQQDGRFHFHQIRLQTFTGHTGTVRTLAPLPSEDFFLSTGRDRTVRLWPLYNQGDGTGTVEPRLTYAHHRRPVYCAQQLGALQQVASCDGTVHIWDQFTGKPIRIFDCFDSRNPITAVAAMPAPHCSLLVGTSDSVLHFIDPRKSGLQHEFRLGINASAGLIRCMAISPSGRSVAVGFSSGFIYLLDTRTGLILKVWPAHESDILQLKSTEGNVLVSSSTDHSLTVWKESDPKPLQHYKSPSDPVHAFDLHGHDVVAGTVANRIGIYSLDGSVPVATSKLSWENFRGVLTSLAMLPAKRLLLLGSDNGMIRLLA
ncbi:WD repeat-containing protein 81 [Amblyraja radiata]|uniref:WD repeat-containing protein 81 n=1 Tax=Amblyraja radiata TaxID=386614 RepID=UPI0014020CB9|nr:WD repeat-containing protein 81 [Amblyraja radiata]